jgi:hypothetical protein
MCGVAIGNHVTKTWPNIKISLTNSMQIFPAFIVESAQLFPLEDL